MAANALGNRRQCPECKVTLTRYSWSKLWWMSAALSGRLVQPCAECGARLRLSSMAVLSSLSSIGVIGTALAYILYPTTILLYIALVLLLLLLIAMLTTRIESVSAGKSLPAEAVPPPRNEPPRA